jgi:hypothetical protein
MDIQTMIMLMGVLAGVWGVTAWFIYRRARATMVGKGPDEGADE